MRALDRDEISFLVDDQRADGAPLQHPPLSQFAGCLVYGGLLRGALVGEAPSALDDRLGINTTFDGRDD